MRIYLLTFLAIIFMVSCTDREIPDLKETANSITLNAKLCSALEAADNLKKEIYGENTRSKFEELHILPIVRNTTRTEQDTIFYIINYSGGNGFSVISTKNDENYVYAISNNGHLSIEDTIHNKGLATFFSNLEDDILNSSLPGLKPNPGGDIDSTFQQDPGMEMVRNYNISYVKPQLAPNVRNWHQESPFNKYCPTIGDNNCLVGCMALSTAQILSYHKWPLTIEGISLNWDNLCSANSDMTYQLLHKLGNENYYNLNYNLDRTFQYEIDPFNNVNNVKRIFQKLGYAKLEDSKDFKKGTPMLDIYNNGPILISSHNQPSILSDMHMWVIDGYHSTYYEVKSVSIDTSKQEWIPVITTLYHCVWGEKSCADGYFYWGSDNKIGGSAPSMTDKDDREGGSICQYHLRYYTGFKPNK